MATGYSLPAWKIPWTAELGRLQSMRSQSPTRLSNFTFTLINLKVNSVLNIVPWESNVILSIIYFKIFYQRQCGKYVFNIFVKYVNLTT